MALDFPNSSIEQTYIAPNGVTYVWNGTSWVVTPILSVSKGGTGFTSYAHGDILYGNSSGTLSKLNPSTSGYVLSTNGTGADPSWMPVATGQTISTPSVAKIFSFYPGTATSLTGSTGIEYTNSSSLLMTVTAQQTSQQSLKVSGTPTSSSVPIFSVDGSSSSQFLVLNNIAGQNGIAVGINPSAASATWALLVNNSSQDTRFQVDTKDNLVQLKKGTQLQLFESVGDYYSGFKATSATANTTYTLPPTTPSTGTSVLQSTPDGVMTWVAMSVSGGAGTVATGAVSELAYYVGTGASVKSATGLNYSSSANILTVTSQATTDVVLQLKGFSSMQTGDAIVYKKDGTTTTFKVDKDGVISSGTWAGNAVTAYYGGTGQQSYTDGQLLIGNSATTGLTKANLTAGVGLSVVNGNGSITVNNNRPVVLNLASGFTPVGIGTDYNVLRVPEGKNLANTNYNIREVILGVGVTSSGTSTIRLEKSVGPHTGYSGFNLSAVASTTNVMSADLSIIGGIGETSWITFAAGHGTVATGDRIRINYSAVDVAHANFIIQCVLEEY